MSRVPSPILSRPRAAVLLAAMAAATLLAAAGPAAARDQSFRLVYQGSLAELPVVTATVEVRMPARSQNRGPYEMGLDVAVTGAFAKMLPFRMQAEATGTTGAPASGAADGVAPKRFTSTITSFGETKRVRLDYGNKGEVRIRSEPPTEEARDVERHRLSRGTMDPLSAIAAIVDGVARTGRCEGALAVFDGVRRYDLTLSHVGAAAVTRQRQSIYEGPAVECLAVPDFRAGFRQADLDAGFYPKTASLWLAPVLAGAPPLPVRLMARGALGTIRLELLAAERIE
jgi:hypothetical protein